VVAVGCGWGWRTRAGWLAVVALLLGLGVPAAPAGAAASAVYYATNQGDRVLPFSIGGDGALAPIPCPGSNCSAASPAGEAVSPDGRFLYTGGFNDVISAYAIGADGSLSPVPCAGSCNTGGTVFQVAITPDGRFLYAPTRGVPGQFPVPGRVAVFAIAGDGSLSPVACPGSNCATPTPSPNAPVVTPNGKFLYVTTAASDFTAPGSVLIFQIGGDGTLTPVTCPATNCNTGASPVGSSITPDGRYLYTANNFGGDVSAFAVGNDGALTPIPCPGTSCKVIDFPSAVAVSPNGRFVYAANIGGAVSVFSIGADGSLTSVPCSGCAIPDRQFTGLAVSPGARFLYTASGFGRNKTLSVFAVAADGTLSPVNCSACNTGQQSNSQALVVSPDQAPVAAFSATAAAAGQASRFDGSASRASPGQRVARYDWSFGDGTSVIDGGATPTHRYAAPGRYAVTLTVTDDAGCSTAFVFTGQTASCNGGPAASRTVEVTVASASAPIPTPVRTKSARITALRASARCYRDARLDEAPARGRRAMRFNYRLSDAATVRLTVRRRTGSPRWTSCPARRGRTPLPYTDVRSRTEHGKAGENQTQIGSAARIRAARRLQLVRQRSRVHGRITLRRLLAGTRLLPGTYVLTVAALDAAGHPTSERHVKFWVYSPRRR
jgi:6-phosphogluconolactonase